MDSGKDVLTTGEVARLCRVTIRTVIKWYEQGRLDGYRIPGSRDRRFTRDSVQRFMRDHHMPQSLLEEAGGGRRKVLVVEDDEAVRVMIARFLEGLGVLDVDTASSGWEAGLKTAANKPDLLLLDFRLGDATGDQVISTIRGMEGIEQPAIVVMSAHLAPEQAEALLQLGADGFIPKPFDMNVLRDTIYRHVGLAS